jgi:release factor glutamine methyltransferase
VWTIERVLKWTVEHFTERGLPTARLDAEVMLASVLGRDRVFLYTHFDQPLGADELARYRELIKRRLVGEPVAYLVGKREFHSLLLDVDARVLVPRPDTETLVEVALALALPEAARVVDVGTGSGAVALAIKKARGDLEVLAIDRSPDAAEVARANAARLGLAVEVVIGDLLAPVAARAPFALVVSNPPYIPTRDLASLPPEVKKEPRAALDGGADGLDIIRRLIAEAPPLLGEGGVVALEVGQGQAPAVVALFAGDGRYAPAETRKDLATIVRVVSARKS